MTVAGVAISSEDSAGDAGCALRWLAAGTDDGGLGLAPGTGADGRLGLASGAGGDGLGRTSAPGRLHACAATGNLAVEQRRSGTDADGLGRSAGTAAGWLHARAAAGGLAAVEPRGSGLGSAAAAASGWFQARAAAVLDAERRLQRAASRSQGDAGGGGGTASAGPGVAWSRRPRPRQHAALVDDKGRRARFTDAVRPRDGAGRRPRRGAAGDSAGAGAARADGTDGGGARPHAELLGRGSCGTTAGSGAARRATGAVAARRSGSTAVAQRDKGPRFDRPRGPRPARGAAGEAAPRRDGRGQRRGPAVRGQGLGRAAAADRPKLRRRGDEEVRRGLGRPPRRQ